MSDISVQIVPVLLQIIVDFVYNNHSVYYRSYTFHYSTLEIPVLYMETVPPRVQPPEGRRVLG